MATLIYTEMADDKLKLIAEVEDDNVELAVDALLDAEPKLASQQPFVCFPSEARQVVEAEEEVVQPRRKITVKGGVTASAPARRQRRAAPQKPGPKPGPKAGARRGRGTAKPGPKKGSTTAKKTAAKGGKATAKKNVTAKPKPKAKPSVRSKGGGGFKRNAASDE